MFNNFPVNSRLKTYEVDTPSFWDDIYKNGSPAWGTLPATVLDKFVSYINGNKVLDIGCGEGRNSFYLEKLGFEVTGVDISQVAIEKAKSKHTTCQFFCNNLIIDKWPDTMYNAIIDFGLFHFVPPEYKDNYIKNIFDHLTPDGVYCNQSGRLIKDNPIIGKGYIPPQLEQEEITDYFKKYNIVLLEEDLLPEQNGYKKYPCWNLIVKK